jgi:hypothetical protein
MEVPGYGPTVDRGGRRVALELNEPKLADRLIIERAAELDGGFYGSLTSLVEKARNEGCFLAATLRRDDRKKAHEEKDRQVAATALR